MQIHVTEEARHICFAREYMRRHVPRLAWHRRASLVVQVPVLLAQMAHQMLRPSGYVVRTYDIPPEVVREAFTRNPVHRAAVMESLAGVRELCVELGIVTGGTRWLWRRLGIWDDGAAEV